MVFISYSSADYVMANRIRNILIQNNIECWMAPESIPGGSDYAHEIPSAIENCEYFLLVLSYDAQKSIWVPKELDLAIDYKKIVLPVKIDASVMEPSFKLRLSNVQCMDASNRFDEILQLVSNRINGKDMIPNASDISSDLPDELSFYELLGVSSSRDIDIDKLRSTTDITKSMAIPIGRNDEGDIVQLDLHHKGDGPNSIIVGPVGSGKSEFIETVLLSLALFFSEDDVIFNMIDLKGGGIAHELLGLPHLKATLTDASHTSINDYLLYLEKEASKRRQQLEENGVKNIYQYLKLRKDNPSVYPPMPHIIVAIDELAVLKSEYPEAAHDIIAMIDGKFASNFGIHLIISTQYVWGIIDEVIVEKVTNRICSSMQDDLSLTDPVQGKNNIPGRLYFQSEAHDFVQLIQLAYCGMIDDPKLTNKAELKDYGWYYRKSQKDALIGLLRRYNLD